MLHPFMGIEQWNRIGISVEESARRLQRIGFVDRRLMRLEAGHMCARPEYEVKGALARFCWQDAYHHDQLRNRCKQLRMSTVAFDKCPDERLETLMEEVLRSPDTIRLLTALFEVVKPASVVACRRYVEAAQPIVDEPTILMLRHQLIDREDQLAWGIEALRVLRSAADSESLAFAAVWKAHIAQLLEAAGGIDGQLPCKELDPALVVQSKPFELPRESTRDTRFRTAIIKNEGITFEDNDQGRFKSMLFARYFEMSPAEGVAAVHFMAQGKPWAFYLDTARHCWDEVRHAWFGEAALRDMGFDVTSVPNWTGWHHMTMNLFNLDEAYTHLTIAIEKAAMKYPPGKREEWEFARDVAKHPLMTTFQDFDWADEVVHAGFGQRWIIDELFGGDAVQAAEAAERTVTARKAFMASLERGEEPTSRFAGGY